ncbi:hypothetical protein [Arthrobacter livingstonensis]|uniref:hypothetical protein n=1 Tax=Arthrobacter livingstonensis TaxID=670078 RepID=UPI0027954F12|nr:hypothetical protein [Arthrobacter livingstonensis]
MKISVVGCGYLGSGHAAALASLGHDVVGLDTDGAKVGRLARGDAPFHEPGLPSLLRSGRESGRLVFTTDPARLAGVAAMLAGTGAVFAWNPEFLRQGTAVADALAPDRIVYGLPEGRAVRVPGPCSMPFTRPCCPAAPRAWPPTTPPPSWPRSPPMPSWP